MSADAATIGVRGENIASSFLKQKGCKIVARNYRVLGGEIDVIVYDGDTLVFVEVKARSRSTYGYPEESVTKHKQERIARAARHFLTRFPSNASYRFDIIAIEHIDSDKPAVHHIENFFDSPLY